MNILVKRFFIRLFYKIVNAVTSVFQKLKTPTDESITCSVWNINNKDFVFPESELPQFNEKEDIGIALPGGGVRSCAYSLGVLRALHKLNVLQKAKYLTSVSGSSWLNAIYSYQKLYTNNEILGEYIPPTELNYSKLSNIQTSTEIANVLHDFTVIPDVIHNFILTKIVTSVENCLKVNDKTDDFLSRCYGDSFFAKYGLNNFDTIPTIKNKTLSKYTPVEELRPDVPFPIILGTVLIQDTEIKSPMEFTPMYYGINTVNPDIKGSGIYVEPTGYLTFTKNDVKPDIAEYTFDTSVKACTNNVISILKASGISSNYEPLLIRLPNTIYDFTELPQMDYFDQDVILCDGVVIGDNSGVTSLLKRKVKNIILICSFNSSDDSSLDNKYFVENNTDIIQMFEDSNPRQLFKSSYYPELISSFNKLILKNKPLVVKMDIETVSNTRYGIVIKDGNKYTPTVTFIHPSRNEWLNLIPKDSKDYIDNDKSILKSKLSYLSATNATFINYPFTSFFHLNMSVEYIVAMSQNGSYDIMSNSKLFEI
jgi:hypothetical protein